MPKISISVAIAMAIHIFIVFVVGVLITKRPTPIFLNTEKSINVQLGPSSSGLVSERSALTSNPRFKKINNDAVTSNQINISNNENDTGNGSAEDNGIYDFNNLAVSYKEPIYPRLAIKRELQGSVKIRVTVSREGRPSNTKILKSSGHVILDQAALEAVQYWQFQPKNNSYFVEKTIIFQLKN